MTTDEKLDYIIAMLEELTSKRQKSAPDETVKAAVLPFLERATASRQPFRLTATEIAERCGLGTDKGTLMQIGKVIDASGYQVARVKSGNRRQFVFKGIA